jgi:transcriptional regulator NrdR family protein
MKCPICNVWTNVLDTRNKNGVTVRRRECANEHIFKTEERFVSPKLKEKDELPSRITAAS